MRAEVTLIQLQYNEMLRNFFFRTQAWRTVEQLIERSVWDDSETLMRLEDTAEFMGMTLDDLEEEFYNNSVEDCAELFGIELSEEGEEK